MNNKKQKEESIHKMSNEKTLELAKEAARRFMARENYQELMMTPDPEISIWNSRKGARS